MNQQQARQRVVKLGAHLVVSCIKVSRITPSSTTVINAARSLVAIMTINGARLRKAADSLRAVQTHAIIIVASTSRSTSSAALIFATVHVVDTTPPSIKLIADDSTMLLSTKHLPIASSDGADVGGALAIRSDIAISHGKTSTLARVQHCVFEQSASIAQEPTMLGATQGGAIG